MFWVIEVAEALQDVLMVNEIDNKANSEIILAEREKTIEN